MTRRQASDGRTGRGFTLIELLVVVAIIALLISILLPALGNARSQAKEAMCRSNLHQLALATVRYSDDNEGRLPYIDHTMVGTTPTSRRQYDQIFELYLYIQSLKIYKCPSAAGESSIKDWEAKSTSGDTLYTVKKDDDLYISSRQLWPDINPADYPGKLVTPLYTEYYFNDWYAGAKDPKTNQEIPQVAGGVISKIPFVNYTVALCDAYQVKQMRHGKGMLFGYLDAHVDKLPKIRYFDEGYKRMGIQTPRDLDPWNNRPFYAWGLTRTGVDGAVEVE